MTWGTTTVSGGVCEGRKDCEIYLTILEMGWRRELLFRGTVLPTH